MTSLTPLARNAIIWAECGYAVMPIMPRKKTPLIISGVCEHGVKSASRDPQIIERMFSTGYENMAIACEGLIVIDVDTRNGASPPDWVLDATPMVVRTRSGGWHFYFRKDSLDVKNGNNVLGHGIDIKTDNGYVLVPFSTVTYEDGKTGEYEFEGRSNQVYSRWELPPPPKALIEALNQAQQVRLYQKTRNGFADGPIDKNAPFPPSEMIKPLSQTPQTQCCHNTKNRSADDLIDKTSPYYWKVGVLISVAKRMNLTVIDYGDGRLQMLCPCHPDTNPSLSIRVAPNGMVLAYCFAGCEFEKIRAAFGLPWEFWTKPKEVKTRTNVIIC